MSYKNNDQKYFISQYFDFIKKLNRPIKPYSELQIREYAKNYQVLLKNNIRNKIWFWQRHHIDEIHTSGAILMANKEVYDKGLTVIVSWKEHAFLHYLIVNAETTSPNFGFLMMVNFEIWDEVARDFCKKYNIKYVPNWHTKFSGLENNLE
ncbi:hypothetical protein [Mesomycoplasma dispar]|uniref:Uncharacterized protein n=1 Tax=Mesomycoplasma dispar TaxID=86660 RepID=A0ABN5DUT7_9BACT|nr:hypothetical protein [Mesomycoplasma dispar]ATP59955.1 hypothetical protein CSW10_03425 [Mesomycoplasma dispar]